MLAGRADASAALERDQQVDALLQAGLLRSFSADLVSRYAVCIRGSAKLYAMSWPDAFYANLIAANQGLDVEEQRDIADNFNEVPPRIRPMSASEVRGGLPARV